MFLAYGHHRVAYVGQFATLCIDDYTYALYKVIYKYRGRQIQS